MNLFLNDLHSYEVVFLIKTTVVEKKGVSLSCGKPGQKKTLIRTTRTTGFIKCLHYPLINLYIYQGLSALHRIQHLNQESYKKPPSQTEEITSINQERKIKKIRGEVNVRPVV